jgi:transposase
MMMTGAQAVREVGGSSVGVTRVYVCPQRDQLFLLPVCMRDWLEEGHLAWFVLDVVAELDTGALHRRPGGSTGRPPYEPEMMLALLLYAYCCGVRSARRIEAACRTDAAFRQCRRRPRRRVGRTSPILRAGS